MPAQMFLFGLDPDANEFCFQTFDDVELPDGKKRNKTGLARTVPGKCCRRVGPALRTEQARRRTARAARSR
jgi:hypothetical protein